MSNNLPHYNLFPYHQQKIFNVIFSASPIKIIIQTLIRNHLEITIFSEKAPVKLEISLCRDDTAGLQRKKSVIQTKYRPFFFKIQTKYRPIFTTTYKNTDHHYFCVNILGSKFKHCSESGQGSSRMFALKRLFPSQHAYIFHE